MRFEFCKAVADRAHVWMLRLSALILVFASVTLIGSTVQARSFGRRAWAIWQVQTLHRWWETLFRIQRTPVSVQVEVTRCRELGVRMSLGLSGTILEQSLPKESSSLSDRQAQRNRSAFERPEGDGRSHIPMQRQHFHEKGLR